MSRSFHTLVTILQTNLTFKIHTCNFYGVNQSKSIRIHDQLLHKAKNKSAKAEFYDVIGNKVWSCSIDKALVKIFWMTLRAHRGMV